MVNLDAPIPSDPEPRSELSARYVYCITFSLEPASFCRAGIDHRPVHPLSQGVLSALAHDCRPEPYHGDAATMKRWVGAHAAVVEAAWEAAGSVLPMPFNVILRADARKSAESRLRAWLRRNQELLRFRLERLRGKVELEVHILWDGAELARRMSSTSEEIQRLQREMTSEAQSAARCREKITRVVRESLEAKAERDYQAFYERLRAHAEDITRCPSRPRQRRQTLLDVSVLVAREKVSRLGEELAAIGEQAGLEVVCNGPWPPYSFAPEVTLAALRQAQDRPCRAIQGRPERSRGAAGDFDGTRR